MQILSTNADGTAHPVEEVNDEIVVSRFAYNCFAVNKGVVDT